MPPAIGELESKNGEGGTDQSLPHKFCAWRKTERLLLGNLGVIIHEAEHAEPDHEQECKQARH